jgi:hypothetical protein
VGLKITRLILLPKLRNLFKYGYKI